jgi:hypothetical protein
MSLASIYTVILTAFLPSAEWYLFFAAAGFSAIDKEIA